MSRDEQPLLSDFLEELKTYRKGAFLNQFVHIFYNDWSLNPYYDDDCSERITLRCGMLKNLTPKEFQSYKVIWWDKDRLEKNFIEICVKRWMNETD